MKSFYAFCSAFVFKVCGSFQLTLGSELGQCFSTSKLLLGQVNRDETCHICVAGVTAFQKMI